MRVEQLLPATVRRLRRAGLWAGAVGLGLLWALVRLNLRVPFGRYGAMEAWLPGLLLVLTLLFAPLPWQWTGDDRPLAPAWRGLLQSFLFDAVWVGLLLGALAPAAARRPRPLPPPPEFEAAPPRSQPPPPPLSLDLFHGSLGLLL
ncbi:MAG TPA: hypothetical protein VJ600_03420, partial [Holophagaceae bacterium]|nr:hypothetical protein [Holophagaceae bacterium]